MTVPFDLDGAVAVLTGADSGIGHASAIALAARDARVAVIEIDDARAAEIAAMIGEAVAVAADVTVLAALEHLRDPDGARPPGSSSPASWAASSPTQ